MRRTTAMYSCVLLGNIERGYSTMPEHSMTLTWLYHVTSCLERKASVLLK